MKRRTLISKSKIFFWCCVATLICTALYSAYTSITKNYPYNSYVEFTGFISSEPDVRLDGVRYIVQTEQYGKVYTKYMLFPRFLYGDILDIKCKLTKPEPIEDFRYDMYLARYGVYAICGNPSIMKIGEGEGNIVMRHILKLKESVAIRVNELWQEPHASFMAGLLYGYRGGLGSLNDLFSKAGVTHIVAISGYNISIVSVILMKICVHLLIPRKKAFWCIVVGIIGFLIFAGLSASVLRAGIMGIIVLLATQLGRKSRVLNVLVLTATIMALINPYILLYDAGFQLSFISTIGLIYLSPKLEKYFTKIPEKFALRESATSTFSAIIATLPLILFQFKRLSLVAPIVNVLILWLIPWIMAVGFFAVLFSFIFMPLGIALSWIAYIAMEYIIRVVTIFADLQFATFDFGIPIYAMIAGYAGLFFVIRFSSRKK